MNLKSANSLVKLKKRIETLYRTNSKIRDRTLLLISTLIAIYTWFWVNTNVESF